jgi:hypothetical protein
MKRIQFAAILMAGFCLLNAMEIPFSTVPIKTDANLITNLVRIDPDDRKPETLPTQAWLWYDEDNLYVLAEGRIDSTFSEGLFAQRDADSKGDYLFLHLITNPKTKYSYHYSATPNGVLAEGTKDINLGSSYDWNSSYSYKTEHNDTLWTVVFKLPFKDMRFSRNPPYKWEIRLSRFHEKSREYYAFPYYKDGDEKDFFDKTLSVTLTHAIKGKRDWKFRPYFVKSYDLVNRESTFDPENVGLDVSSNPSTRTKLKMAFNPDFTDVPPDDASNIYNEKNPPYYSENRFFFIEDIDAFGVSEDFFYTRNIVQPQLAVKFTGNTNTLNYGYLGAWDKKITEDGELLNPDDFYQLMAINYKQTKYLFHSAIGSRMNRDYFNHFLQGDWDWEFIPNLHVGTFHTYTMKHGDAYSEDIEENKEGLYQKVYLNMTPGNWDISANYQNLQKDVTLDMGYLYETGLEGYSGNVSWSMRPREKYLRSASVSLDGGYYNRLEPNRPFNSASGSALAMASFLPKYTLLGMCHINREEYLGKIHNTWNASFSPSLSRWPGFNPALAFTTGKTIIWSLNETSDFYTFRANASGRAGHGLSWSVVGYHYQYDYDRVNFIYTPTDTITIRLDDSYQIANAYLYYDFSNRMTIRNGLGISTYKTGSRYSNLTFYSNFRYEFNKDWFLYLGYKTGQSQDEPSTLNDLTGHFNRNSASAYLKLSLTM